MQLEDFWEYIQKLVANKFKNYVVNKLKEMHMLYKSWELFCYLTHFFISQIVIPSSIFNVNKIFIVITYCFVKSYKLIIFWNNYDFFIVNVIFIQKFSYSKVKCYLNYTQVVCGQDHTMLLTSDGKVYSFGWSADGQTGMLIW